MATTGLLRASRTTALAVASPSSSFSSSSFSIISHHTSSSATFSTRLNKVGSVDGEKRLAGTSGGGGGERKSAVVTSAVATSENALTTKKRTGSGGVDLAFLVDMIKTAGITSLKVVTRKRPWRLIVQMFIEKVIIDCRFFTMLPVAGSLLGSVLCFLEGCFMIGESYLQYFRAISQGSDQGHVVHLLIEAIDMFLIGNAMLIFGMGLHMMFVGSRNLNGKGSPLPPSNFFGLFYLRKLPSWVGIGSITEAKSKIGHALMMILQVGVLEKFKNIPMASGLDLACFAGAVFVSSACIFLLSKLSLITSTAHH